MSLFDYMIIGAIISLVVVSLFHSILGEKRLLGPLFKYRGNRVLESGFARLVLRFAWHLTSVLWLMMAIVLYFISFAPADFPRGILLTFGIGFLAIGIFALILSRGKHVGWPVLTAIGVFCLAAQTMMSSAL